LVFGNAHARILLHKCTEEAENNQDENVTHTEEVENNQDKEQQAGEINFFETIIIVLLFPIAAICRSTRRKVSHNLRFT
jgi:hypothetical protein